MSIQRLGAFCMALLACSSSDHSSVDTLAPDATLISNVDMQVADLNPDTSMMDAVISGIRPELMPLDGSANLTGATDLATAVSMGTDV